MLLGLCVVALFAAESFADEKKGLHLQVALRWSAIAAGTLQLFVLPAHLGPAAVVIGILFGALGAVFRIWLPSKVKSLAAAAATLILCAATLELLLGYFAPLGGRTMGRIPGTANPSDAGLFPKAQQNNSPEIQQLRLHTQNQFVWVLQARNLHHLKNRMAYTES